MVAENEDMQNPLMQTIEALAKECDLVFAGSAD